jgi:S-formylglutathione hydrolase FrmB
MHDDLINMVNWALAAAIARPDKVAIFGTSNGGLASFIGATFTPEAFCCSVPVAGISNLDLAAASQRVMTSPVPAMRPGLDATVSAILVSINRASCNRVSFDRPD